MYHPNNFELATLRQAELRGERTDDRQARELSRERPQLPSLLRAITEIVQRRRREAVRPVTAAEPVKLA